MVVAPIHGVDEGTAPQGSLLRRAAGAPLPDVAHRIINAEGVRRVLVDRRDSNKTVLGQVLVGEGPLSAVQSFMNVMLRVAPGEGLVLEAAASCGFPFQFRREPLAGPRATQSALHAHSQLHVQGLDARLWPKWRF